LINLEDADVALPFNDVVCSKYLGVEAKKRRESQQFGS
jgi:hypothetical protein